MLPLNFYRCLIVNMALKGWFSGQNKVNSQPLKATQQVMLA
jgi:hypothetical protein